MEKVEENDALKVEVTGVEFVKILLGEKEMRENYKQFYKEEGIINIDNVIVISGVEIKKVNVFENKIEIKGGEFHNYFIISDGDFQNDFKIYGGDFNNDFRIYGGDFNYDFRIYGGNFKNNFSIYGGDFKNNFSIYGGDFKNNFKVEGGKFENEFLIDGGNFIFFLIYRGDFKDFLIYRGDFKNDFKIYGGDFKDFFIYSGDFKNDIKIYGGDFKNSFTIKGGNFNSFSISDGDFKNKFTIISAKFINLELINCKFNNFENITKLTIYEKFNIINNEFNDKFILNDGKLGVLNLIKNNFKEKFEITNFNNENKNYKIEINEIYIENNELKKIEILAKKNDYNIKIKKLLILTEINFYFKIEKIQLNEIYLENIFIDASSGKLYLNSVKIDKFKFINFSNFGLILIIDLKTIENNNNEKEISFFNSIMGNLKFIDTNLNSFNYKIKNTDFSQLNQYNTIENYYFPTEKSKIMLYEVEDTSKNKRETENDVQVVKGQTPEYDTSKNKRETENDVQVVKSQFPEDDTSKIKIETENGVQVVKSQTPEEIKSKNKRETENMLAQTFRDLSVAARKHEDIFLFFKYYSAYQEALYNISKIKRDKSSIISIFFNRWTNNYGQNWILGVKVYFLISLVLFSCFNYDREFLKCLNMIGKTIIEYFIFIFPFSNILSEEFKVLDGSKKLIYMFSQLVLGLILYQIVQAFRKFGRKM